MDIVFEDPPEAALLRHRGAGGKYLEFAIALREHQDRWAVLPDDEPRTEKSAAGTAQNIRRGKMKGFDNGEYDAVPSGVKVYVKWTGPKDQPKAEADDDKEEDPGESPRLRAVAPTRSASPDEVRRWAMNNGMNVPTRGRLPEHIWEAYATAHGEKENVPGY